MPITTKLGRVVTCQEGLLPLDDIVFRDHVTKKPPLYLHFHNANSQQNWQGGDLP